MANELRLKRRLTGNAGAPTALKSGELAWNMIDGIIYGGHGDDGAGAATSILALAGAGAFTTLNTSQTISGAKTFTAIPSVTVDPSSANHVVRKSWVDSKVTSLTNSINGKANTSHTHAIADVTGLQAALDDLSAAEHTHTISDVTGLSTNLTDKQTAIEANTAAIADVNTALAGKAAASHTHSIAQVTNLQSSLNAKANLASPALTGTPTAPTATAGTNTTQLATTAFVQAAVAQLVQSAPAALDTLNELAAALGNNANFATDVSTSLGQKLAKASNLSDLANVATARTNLGLGSIATQNAAAVAITGGAISNVTLSNCTIDNGTF